MNAVLPQNNSQKVNPLSGLKDALICQNTMQMKNY
jgi:hypothetical protein